MVYLLGSPWPVLFPLYFTCKDYISVDPVNDDPLGSLSNLCYTGQSTGRANDKNEFTIYCGTVSIS